MAKDTVLDLNKPRLFTDSVTRQRRSNPGFVKPSKLSDLDLTNFGATSSFRYDSPIMGFKSTQQLNTVDFSEFLYSYHYSLFSSFFSANQKPSPLFL